jgi:integrase
MSRVILTDARVRALKPGPRRRFINDALCPGLVLQVTTQGHRSFMLRGIFPGGRNRVRRLLGEAGALNVDQARAMAREWLAMLATGRDPQLELRERQRQAGAERALSFARVAEAYINDRCCNRRQGARAAKEIRGELISRWGDRPITLITRGDIIEVVDAVRARGQQTAGVRASGSHARTIFAHCNALFNWAALRHDLASSPCDRLRPKDLGLVFKPRTRVLNDREIAALWRACGALGAPFGVFVKVLLLTGARRGEIAGGCWSEIDFESKTWTVPRVRAKADCEHRIALTEDVITLLAGLPRYHSGDFIFTTSYGRRPISGFSKATRRLHNLMRRELGQAMPGWGLHDLRRTFRSRLSELGVSERVAELAIDHARTGIARVYDLHRFEAEIREAFEAWHRRLRDIIEPPPAPADNIVALPLRA